MRQKMSDVMTRAIDGRGKVVVTFAALARALGFPDDSEIYGAEMSPDDLSRSQLVIFVKHDDLPRWREGMEVPRVVPDGEGWL